MKFGVLMFCTDESIDPRELGRAAEDEGFESLFVPEHTHIPTSRATAYPGGGELPREYTRTLDPFVTLTAVAAVTEHLRLGFGICLLVERDPIITGKEVASLDLLSSGRVLFGVGAGWNREEMADHGTDPTTRFDLLTERIEAVKRIWTEDEAAYQGKHVAFDPIWSWPKPVQRPHPPVLVGGEAPSAIDRVLAHGDEWLPRGRVPDLEARVEDLHRRTEQLGRPRLPVSVFGADPSPERIESYAAAGVTRCILPLPSAPADDVLPVLRSHARLVENFNADH